MKKLQRISVIVTLFLVTILFMKFLDSPSVANSLSRKILISTPEFLGLLLIISLMVVKPGIRASVLLLFLVFYSLTYLVDYALFSYSRFSSKQEVLTRLALEGGTSRDERDADLVIKQSDMDLVPALSPANWLRNDGNLFPLSGLARRNTLYCIEGAEWIIYESDRYGFRNNDTVWNDVNTFLMLGDSFTQGGCVRDKDTVAGNLKSEGIKTVNLGWGGT